MLGLCCQWLELRGQTYKNVLGEKHLRLGLYKSGSYSDTRITQTYHNNVDGLINLIPKLIQNNIRVFRMSSNILPLFEFAGDLAKNDQTLLQKLKNLGQLYHQNNIRVTCHPSQFVVLNSDKLEVIQNSIKELSYHAWLFDAIGLSQTPFNAINIHGGKGGKPGLLASVINDLPHNIKGRLTLENDERSYSVSDLISVNIKTNTPITFDSHHHTFNAGGLSMEDAMEIARLTWPVKPMQHLSSSELGCAEKDRRKHSFLINYVPDCQKNVILGDEADVDVEAKGKNLAILDLQKNIGKLEMIRERCLA